MQKYLKKHLNRVRPLAIALFASLFIPTFSHSAIAAPLILTDVGVPTTAGAGVNIRAIWEDAGTVGATGIDIVGVITSATLTHVWTTNGARPSIESTGQDQIFIEWRIYQANTYDVATDTGGVLVPAEVLVQFNDVDGPANEEVYTEVCSGDVEFVRINKNATTGKAFGTVAGRPDIFSIIGDQSYNSEPESGLEISFSTASTFDIGRTADSGFFIRLDNATYSSFDTLDFECADFSSPVANDDDEEGAYGTPTNVDILVNDTIAVDNNNPPYNNSQVASEFAKQSVNLVAPGGATGLNYDGDGDLIGLSVPNEGTWSYADATGLLTFTPLDGFKGYATTVDYTFDNALGATSNAATVTIVYPAIGITKTQTFNDDVSADGYVQIGETVTYDYSVRAYGDSVTGVSVTETGFSGTGTTPTPTYQSGDTNTNSVLDIGETWLYSTSYTLLTADVAAGSLSNQATASGTTSISASAVTDLSDSTHATDGDGTGTHGPGTDNDDVTVLTLADQPIDAVDSVLASPIDAFTTQTDVANVLTTSPGNDTLGAVAATPSNVDLTVFGGAPAGFTLNADGSIDVAAGTTPGEYDLNYQICETLNPTNCDVAAATITVGLAQIGATKTATFNDENANTATEVGETITYTYRLSNVGNLPIVSVGITETGFAGAGTTPVPAYQSGDTNTNSQLDGGEVWIYTASYTLVAADVVAGSVTNQATATGESPNGQSTSDLTDSELATDGNGTGTPGGGANNDDPTTTPLPLPGINAVLDSTPTVNGTTGANDIRDVLANDTLAGPPVVLADVNLTVLTPASDAGVTLDITDGLVSVAAGVPSDTYTITYQICEKANPANCDSAVVTIVVDAAPISAVDDIIVAVIDTATAQTGVVNVLDNDSFNSAPAVYTDVTPTLIGTPPAGFTLNADGTLDIAQYTPSGDYVLDYQICDKVSPASCSAAQIELTIQKSIPVLSGLVFKDDNSNGTFDTGEVQLPNYVVELRQSGTLVQSTTSNSSGRYQFVDFPPGADYQILFIDPASGLTVGKYDDIVVASNDVRSDLDQPIDPSGILYNSITGDPVAGVTVRMLDAGGTPLPAACVLPGQQNQITDATGWYRFDVIAGADPACPAAQTEYQITFAAPTGFLSTPSIIIPPQAGTLDATTCPDDAVPGGSCQLSVDPTPSASSPSPYYLAFLLAPGDPDVVNNHIAVDPESFIPSSGLSATKTANVSYARRGDVVSYTIVLTNTTLLAAGPMRVVDALPEALTFVTGSATVGGAPATPSLVGRDVIFNNVVVPASGTLEITLMARIGQMALAGEHTNTVIMVDPATSQPIAPNATAVIIVEAEHVFDCGEVIGRVFADKNGDGYYDVGEAGLPNVRLVTVDGQVIGTDKHGQYSIPCAALPANMGENFILKLDERTLPQAHRISSENPRVIRLTPGKISKLNFAAEPARAIKIELSAKAFDAHTNQPTRQLRAGLDSFLPTLKTQFATLQLVYFDQSGNRTAAKTQLKNIETEIERYWDSIGTPYELVIQMTIKRAN